MDVKFVLSVNGALVLLLGLFPGAVMTLCANSVTKMLGS
jgi:NADH-quinone oxidoreductase subunit N